MEKKKLFRIGTRIEEQPIYGKIKPSKATIQFTKYSPLVQKKIIKKKLDIHEVDRFYSIECHY